MSKNKVDSKTQTESSLRVELEIPTEKNILEEFIDLSLREILVLFFIMRYPGKMLRNSLREEVNDYLKKDFNPSSFYNILEKLEKKDLIIVEDGKIVQVTQKASDIISELNRLTLICQIDFRGMTENIIPLILERINSSPLTKQKIQNFNPQGNKIFSRTLVINLEIMMDISVLNTIHEQITENLYILSTANEFKRYQARGLSEDIQQSQIIGTKIRETNEFFDSVIIIGYTCLSKYPEKMGILLKNDLKKVMKKGSILFLVSDTHFRVKGEHFLVDLINKIMVESDFLAVTEKEELFTDIQELGFKNHDALELNGMIVGWGYLE